MKYSLAIAALLGLVESSTAFGVIERNSNQEKLFMLMNEQSDDDEFDGHLVQTDKILEKSQGWSGWAPKMDGFPGTQNEFGNWVDPYDRATNTPVIFSGDAADSGYYPTDRFTQNLIENYAEEVASGPAEKGKVALKNHHPLPSGAFVITKGQGYKLAEEILCTHFKKCGADATAYLESFAGDQHSFGTRWEEAWNYWDVLKAGKIDAVGASVLYRHLCKPLGELDLQ